MILVIGKTPRLIIQGALKARGYSISEVAREMGCTRKFIYDLLNGTSTSAEIKRKIDEILSQPLEYSQTLS